MKVFLLLAFFYASLSTTGLAVVTKHAGNETLSVLLLYSTDPSYTSFSSVLTDWVDDAFKAANENTSCYHLELVAQDTKVNLPLSQHRVCMQIWLACWFLSSATENLLWTDISVRGVRVWKHVRGPRDMLKRMMPRSLPYLEEGVSLTQKRS